MRGRQDESQRLRRLSDWMDRTPRSRLTEMRFGALVMTATRLGTTRCGMSRGFISIRQLSSRWRSSKRRRSSNARQV